MYVYTYRPIHEYNFFNCTRKHAACTSVSVFKCIKINNCLLRVLINY